MRSLAPLNAQITGGKTQSDEGAAFFDVRLNLPCWTKPLRGKQKRPEFI